MFALTRQSPHAVEGEPARPFREHLRGERAWADSRRREWILDAHAFMALPVLQILVQQHGAPSCPSGTDDQRVPEGEMVQPVMSIADRISSVVTCTTFACA